jgi:hypothetical protein
MKRYDMYDYDDYDDYDDCDDCEENEKRREDFLEDIEEPLMRYFKKILKDEMDELTSSLKKKTDEHASEVIRNKVSLYAVRYLESGSVKEKMEKLLRETLTETLIKESIEASYGKIHANFKDYSDMYIKTAVKREVQEYFKKQQK